MESLVKYQNGNTTITILKDGTKIREYENTPIIDHPESIDIKITNYCDLGCPYCHESSTTEGIHANLPRLATVLDTLPKGVELAIGGGNPLSHPLIIEFLKWAKEKEFICNLTVNQGHLKNNVVLLHNLIEEELIYGLGISITSNNFTHIKLLKEYTDNIVYHLIVGINEVDIIDKLIELGDAKVLLLGYKKFGFGVKYLNDKVYEGLVNWYKVLPKLVGKCTVSFDNLAIKQLKVERLFTKEGWNKFYMGDDFQYTMYIDAVKEQYAPTSRSHDRVSFNDTTLLEYFKNK